MSRISACVLFLAFAASSLAAKDTPFQIVTWPDSGQPVLRFTFSKFKDIGGVGKERTYITDTAAENISDKTIGSANFSLYVFDRNKARIGEGYINLTNIGAGQTVKFQVTLSASGNPASVAVSTSAPRSDFRAKNPLPAPLAELEPALADMKTPALYLKERSVDPRALVAAALKAAKHRGVDISTGTTVTDVLLSDGRVTGISTDRTHYSTACVVNCAGAWAGSFSSHRFPTRPVKGQMLAVACARHDEFVRRSVAPGSPDASSGRPSKLGHDPRVALRLRG